MLIRDLFLPEFDQEMAATRRVVARLPEDKLQWQPHPKSQSLQALVSHLVSIPTWIGMTLEAPELDFAANKDWEPPQMTGQAKAVATFDANVSSAREKLAKTTDETFGESWTLRHGERIFFTEPKAQVLRSFILNHLIHHRAQLGVYLRLLDVPVPSTYGPTADEPVM